MIETFGVYGGIFVAAAISGFVPLVVIDALLVAVVLKTGANLPAIVGLAALGTLAGKLPTYYAIRGLAAMPGKHRDRVDRARAWIATWKWKHAPIILLAASSSLGLPPFSICGTIAGAVGIRTKPFVVIVLVGRLVRFAVVVAIAREAM